MFFKPFLLRATFWWSVIDFVFPRFAFDFWLQFSFEPHSQDNEELVLVFSRAVFFTCGFLCVSCLWRDLFGRVRNSWWTCDKNRPPLDYLILLKIRLFLWVWFDDLFVRESEIDLSKGIFGVMTIWRSGIGPKCEFLITPILFVLFLCSGYFSTNK